MTFEIKPPQSSLRNNIMVVFFLIIVIWGAFITGLFQFILQDILTKAGLDLTVVDSIARHFTLISTGLTIVGIFAILFIGLLLSKAITEPVEELTKGVMEIAQGRLDIRINITSQDELGQLAEGFNFMTAKIRDSLEKIETAKEYTDNIVATVPSLLLVLNNRLEILSANMPTEKLPYDIMLEEFVTSLENEIKTCLEKVKTLNKEIVLAGKDSEINPAFSVVVSRIKIPEENGVLLTITDITERKQAELQSRRYRIGLEKLDWWVRRLLLVTTDEQYFYEVVAKATLNLLNADIAILAMIDSTGKDFTYKAAAGNKAQTALGVMPTLQGGEFCKWMSNHGDSMLVSDLSGNPGILKNLAEQVDVNTTVVSSLCSDDKTIGYLFAFRKGRQFDKLDEQILSLFSQRILIILDNLRLLLTLEDRVAERTAELKSANDELKSFAYVVSHDLKAPLRAISQLTSWISEDYADAFDRQGKNKIKLLLSRVKRMYKLIDGILDYSKVGRVREKKIQVDLNKLVRDVTDAISPPNNIRITINNDLPVIVCEKTRMEQLFQNLLSNAIKYMNKPRGEINISCVDESKHWKFSVSDNGAGIENEHFDKIFELFQPAIPDDKHESTGLGLTIVQKIVELYGGEIWVESEVGKGSVFFFTLLKD